jgi:hypothetical protein
MESLAITRSSVLSTSSYSSSFSNNFSASIREPKARRSVETALAHRWPISLPSPLVLAWLLQKQLRQQTGIKRGIEMGQRFGAGWKKVRRHPGRNEQPQRRSGEIDPAAAICPDRK